MSRNTQTALAAVVAAVLVAFTAELSAGRVPFPPELAWLIPIVVAALVALTERLQVQPKPRKPAVKQPVKHG